jgi:dTDP-glucose pyrophosphorylase
MALQILMPMGGLGLRFKNAGYAVPKPLIPVLGIPMFERAINTFDRYEGDKTYIVVVRQDTNLEYNLANKILQICPDAKIVILDHNTEGAVETCLYAETHIDPQQPLIIMDCDISFDSNEYFLLIQQAIRSRKTDGVLLSFESTDDRYSYAKVDASGMVEETAEKVAISNNALMGAYFFTRASDFIVAGHELMTKQLSSAMKEYYISLVFNIMLEKGKKIALAKGVFYCFGTPEELQAYETLNPTSKPFYAKKDTQ